METHSVKSKPCATCPYAKSTPLGIWDISEYEKLPSYDGEMDEQAMKGGTSVFHCHYDNGCLCRGWIDCHGAENLIALRFAAVMGGKFMPEIGEPEVECYESGEEVLLTNLQEIEDPSDEAKEMMARIIAGREKRKESE